MDPKLHKQGPKGHKVVYRGPSATSALGHPDNAERDARQAEISAKVAEVRRRILAQFPGAQVALQRPPRPLTEEEMDQIVEEACTALAESDLEATPQPESPAPDDDWRAEIDRIVDRYKGGS